MNGPRIDKLADLLVHHSLRTQPGELLALVGMPLAMPLILARYRSAISGAAARSTPTDGSS